MKNIQKRVAHFPENVKGRDFVVGDIHGLFSAFEASLRSIDFNPDCDRVFSVGDLIDRGNESSRITEFLDKPWFFSVMGNHEMLLLDAQFDEDIYLVWTQYNGGSWWDNVNETKRSSIIQAIEQLPIVIEVETHSGLTGVVHADVEQDMDWSTFVAAIEKNDALHFDCAWSRERLFRYDTYGYSKAIEGVDKVVFGHTPRDRPLIIENTYYIDTGAVYEMETRGVLTLMQIQPEVSFINYPVYT